MFMFYSVAARNDEKWRNDDGTADTVVKANSERVSMRVLIGLRFHARDYRDKIIASQLDSTPATSAHTNID